MLNDISLLVIVVMLSSVIGILACIAYKIRARFLHLDKQLSQITNSTNNRIDKCITSFARSLDEKILEVQNAMSLTHMPFKFPVFIGDVSLDSFNAKFLVQYLVENNPKTIVELGSGSSTVIISQVLKLLGVEDVCHISVDHDRRYLDISKRWASLAGITDEVKFLYAPLSRLPGQDIQWYSGVVDALQGRKVDLVFVDGPPAYEAGFEQARYPALPVLFDSLSSNCAIILDDANRKGEQEVIRRWLSEYQEFNVTYENRGKGVAVLRRNDT